MTNAKILLNNFDMQISKSKIFSLVLIDLFKTILYFPVWWYSKGFLSFVNLCWQFIQNINNTIGVYIWIKNIFTPLYGAVGWQDRIISFILRLVQIIFRSVAMVIIIAVLIFFILLWLLLPILLIYQLIY